MSTCWLNEDCVAPNKHDGDCLFPASDGQLCMIDRPATASQHGESFRTARTPHKVTCAGCDCEPGEVCDTKRRCHYCGHSKTACDAYRSDPEADQQCCKRCDHRG